MGCVTIFGVCLTQFHQGISFLRRGTFLQHCQCVESTEVELFCMQDEAQFRHAIREEARVAQRKCVYHTVGISSSSLNHSSDPFAFQSQTQYFLPADPAIVHEHMPGGMAVNTSVLIPVPGGKMQTRNYGVLERCDITSKTRWTFDRFGPFRITGGNEWASAYWEDVGGFAEKLVDEDAVWITAFGFAPITRDSSIVGNPPVHIHHMHVTASQASRYIREHAHYTLQSGQASDGGLGVAFDIHGDRQCMPKFGGTDCLIRAFPKGYGMHLGDAWRTFFDINDVRSPYSTSFELYTLHSFRWSTSVLIPVGRFMAFLPYFKMASRDTDDYLLYFDPCCTTQYLLWSEQKFRHDGIFVHLFVHTHHKYTSEILIMDTGAEVIGLRSRFLKAGFVNLTASNRTIARVNSTITRNTSSLRCVLNKERWEKMPSGVVEERYRVPHCRLPWQFKHADPFTLIAFHEVGKELNLTHAQIRIPHAKFIWMHTVLYGFYISDGGPIPHAESAVCGTVPCMSKLWLWSDNTTKR